MAQGQIKTAQKILSFWYWFVGHHYQTL